MHQMQPKSLLDDFLAEQPTELQNRILGLSLKLGIPTNDPFYVFLIVAGYVEGLLEDKPKQVDALFEDWEARLRADLELESQRALEQQNKAIKIEMIKATKELLNKSKLEQRQITWWNYFQGGGVVLGAIAVGIVLGLAVPPWLEGGLTESRKLTTVQSESLHWATSNEGKLARQIMDWNRDTLADRSCKEDAKKLKVTIVVGQKKAKSGYCVIWVVPARERR
ncbi:DUF6753 family protein [Merismopedia glauca]|uniref:Uncharacterized protein n=2 Tax=Merismopedia TaxID=53402 RepID=A0A2T1C3F2_9CYAN|nr:DUF6753 family protein [Merismopedia glauca]PSB02791.1 hypothetical protein C7B64_11605 [Merismopedia glauca CCAP 1448/3]